MTRGFVLFVIYVTIVHEKDAQVPLSWNEICNNNETGAAFEIRIR